MWTCYFATKPYGVTIHLNELDEPIWMTDWVIEFAGELTLSPLNKLSSAKFLVCVKFQSASMLTKVGDNVVWVSNSLEMGDIGVSSWSNLFAYGTLVVLGGLRVNLLYL